VTSAELEARVQAIAARPYPTRLSGNPEDGYLVEVPDLPGCMTTAMDPFEAYARVREAIEAWVEDALESGEEVPGPSQLARRTLAVNVSEDAYQNLVQRANRLGLSPEQAVTVMVEGPSPISDPVTVGRGSESDRIRHLKDVDQATDADMRPGIASAENAAAPGGRAESR
jgi:antitoxin HicB